jgi:hypothetical protein
MIQGGREARQKRALAAAVAEVVVGQTEVLATELSALRGEVHALRGEVQELRAREWPATTPATTPLRARVSNAASRVADFVLIRQRDGGQTE